MSIEWKVIVYLLVAGSVALNHLDAIERTDAEDRDVGLSAWMVGLTWPFLLGRWIWAKAIQLQNYFLEGGWGRSWQVALRVVKAKESD